MKRFLSLVLAMLIAITILIIPASAENYATAVVKGGWLRLRAEASASSETISAYFTGTQVTIIGTSGEWYYVLTPDGHYGFMNSNYLTAGLLKLRGIDIPWKDNPVHRLEQVRYTMQRMTEETGVGTADVKRRMVDYGVQPYMESHVPVLVPEPFTIEPGESYTREELDECVAIIAKIVDEAYSTPEVVKTAPHRGSVKRVDEHAADDPARWAFTWRAWQRKHAGS